MTLPIFAAVLGVLVAAASIGIPQLVRRRHQVNNDDDTRDYLAETGRSARDIALGNSDQPGGAESSPAPPPSGLAERRGSQPRPFRKIKTSIIPNGPAVPREPQPTD